MEGRSGTHRVAERLMREGAEACSTVELTAAVLGTKRAMEQAARVSEMGSELLTAMPEELMRYGLPKSAAVRLRAAISLGVRLCAEPPAVRPQMHGPTDVFRLVEAEMTLLDQEELWVLCLDVKNRVRKIDRVVKGSTLGVTVRTAEIFRTAIRIGAPVVVLVHNHPSGDPEPSGEDIALTKAVVEAGRLLEIDVLDHIIIGKHRFISLKDRGHF